MRAKQRGSGKKEVILASNNNEKSSGQESIKGSKLPESKQRATEAEKTSSPLAPRSIDPANLEPVAEYATLLPLCDSSGPRKEKVETSRGHQKNLI